MAVGRHAVAACSETLLKVPDWIGKSASYSTRKTPNLPRPLRLTKLEEHLVNKLKPTIIGEIGEFVAQHYLQRNGYEVVQFGKAMSRSRKKQIFKTCNLPLVPDFGIGYAFGDFSPANSFEPYTGWIDSEYPAWADFKYQDIQELAKECRNHSVCEMRDTKPQSAPCFKVEKILDKEWLLSITPYNSQFTDYDDNGNEIKHKGHKLVFMCLENFTSILINRNKQAPPYGKDFLLVNMLVTEYIKRCYMEHHDKNKPPHNCREIVDVQKKYGADAALKMKNENDLVLSQALEKFPGYAHFPGRYDFIGYKNDDLFAIEVKVNSSSINYWQIVRLALLKRFGCKIMTLRITMTAEQLQNASVGGDPEFENITIGNDVDVSGVNLPSDAEFIKTLNYVADHEKVTLEG